MSDKAVIKFELKGPGMTREEFGWADLREFTEALHEAVRALGGAQVDSIIPVFLEWDSVDPHLLANTNLRDPIYRLREGPSSRWTPQQLRGTERFYGFLRDRSIAARCGARKLKPVKVPDPLALHLIREHTSAFGVIEQVGGREGTVRVKFDQFDRMTCKAGPQVAKRLGAHLYERVLLIGTRELHPTTLSTERFTIRAFEAKARMGTGSFVDDMERLLAGKVGSYEEFMEELGR